MSGTDLLYWRRKREHWRLLAEGAPDDATADYLHAYFRTHRPHDLGPMAQDWWAAFGVGENDKTICCTDTNGVAIVCIQALHRLLEETRQGAAELRQRLDRLEQHAALEDAAHTQTDPGRRRESAAHR
ncbi:MULTISPECIES: hypothetical protein [unclassified Streptomyces]|uniref:hypothetical protein n=1 Tax=unclassified Streptomyces TaxID=2593676 RepID=UPI0036EC0428